MTERPQLSLGDIWTHDEKSAPARFGSLLLHAAALGLLCLPLWRPIAPLPRPAETLPEFLPAPQTISEPQPAAHRMSSGAAWSRPATPTPVSSQAIQPLVAPTAIVALGSVLSEPFGLMTNSASAGPFGSPTSGVGGPDGPAGSCTGSPCGTGNASVTQPPVAIYQPDPDYSDAARKAKLQGTVELEITITADGRVTQPQVVSPLGMGLDEKAVAAVLQWRFHPAMSGGRPVAVKANVEVSFRLY